MADITVANKYKVAYELSVNIFTFDRSSYFKVKIKVSSCTFLQGWKYCHKSIIIKVLQYFLVLVTVLQILLK